MSNQQVKIKRGFSFKTFFFGIFMGLLLTIGGIVGLGFFAYNKLSAEWVNNTFKANVNLGTEELNKKTLKDLVNNATYIANNLDTYTINDLKTDFGVEIDDEIMGLNIEDLKDVPFNDLLDKIENKLGSISAYELKDILDLSSMDSILGKYNTYYYDSVNNKIWKNASLNGSVGFDYAITNNVITIKDTTFNIVDGKVDIQLKYLPLSVAIGDFTSTMGDKITLGDLESDFGVDLPSYFDAIDKDTTINQLETEINKLQLGNFLGYDYNETTNKFFHNGTEITGIMKAIAYTSISGIPDKMNSLVIKDLFDEEDLSSGVLSLIDSTKSVDKIPDEINRVVQNTTLATLVEKNVITVNGYNPNKEISVGGINIKISQLTIPQILETIMAS